MASAQPQEKPPASGIGIMLRLTLRYPGTLAVIVVLAILGGLATAPTPYFAKILIDHFITRGPSAAGAAPGAPWSHAVWMIVLIVALGILMKVVTAALQAWQSHYILSITRNSLYETRLETALRVMGAPQSFFESMEPARIASRITNDVNNMDGSIYTVMRQVISSVFLLVIVIGFMLAMNPWLAAVILVTIPVTAFVSYFVFQKMREYNREESDRVANLNAAVTETFQGIKILRTFGAEPWFLGRIREKAEALRHDGLIHWTVFHAITGYIQLVSSLGGDLFLLVGGLLTYQGRITFGEFFAFFSYQGMLWGPINILLNTGTMVQTGAAGAEKVAELQDVPQEGYLVGPERHKGGAFRGEIEGRGLCFGYHAEEMVLDNVDLRIPAGSMTALVGQSGSGKTTLAGLLMGLHLPTRGGLLIDGVDIRDWDLRALRSHIGIVLQDSLLFNDTLRANLTLGRAELSDDRIWAALRLAHLDDLVERLPKGLDTHVGVSGARLSGGQKQRIAIARVFLKDPKLLILDEATSALDSETEKAIQRSFDALLVGRTAVVIAHRLSTIYRADQILVLHQGRLVESGTHDDLCARPSGRYRDLFEAQVEGMIPMSGATRKPWTPRH